MKLHALLILLAAVPALAEPPIGTNTVGTRSICVLPARDSLAFTDWASGVSGSVVRAGQEVKNGTRKYFCIDSTNAVSSVAPAHATGISIGADGIAWQEYSTATKATRTGLAVTKMSSNGVMYASIGSPAVVGKGVPLFTKCSTFLIPSGAPQDAVFVVSEAADDSVSAQDW